MLAISHTLHLAHQTIHTHSGPREDVELEKVKVYSGSGKAVALINEDLRDASNRLGDIASTNDHKMILKVLAEVRQLEEGGVEVEIAGAAVEYTGIGKLVSARAKTMATQVGRNASRHRHHLAQEIAQDSVAVELLGDGNGRANDTGASHANRNTLSERSAVQSMTRTTRQSTTQVDYEN
jgi:hypothetical protein